MAIFNRMYTVNHIQNNHKNLIFSKSRTSDKEYNIAITASNPTEFLFTSIHLKKPKEEEEGFKP